MDLNSQDGLKILTDEFELFLNDAINYRISNIFLNENDIKYNSKEYKGPVKRFETLKSRITAIGNGVIIEFNHNIFYKFSTGFGICDYHLKLSKPDKFPINEKYVSVRDTNISVLKELINKNPCEVKPSTCHKEKTVLKGLKFTNYDKTKFSIIGHHFEFEDELGKYEFYDGAWILTDEKAVENMKYL